MYNVENHNKIATLLRFAKKSGNVVNGYDAVELQVKKKKVHLILLATDLSPGKQADVRRFAGNTEVVIWGDKDTYLEILGKYTGIVGILAESFKKGIKEYMNNLQYISKVEA